MYMYINTSVLISVYTPVTPSQDSVTLIYTVSSVVGTVIILVLVMVSILIVGFCIKQRKRTEGMNDIIN